MPFPVFISYARTDRDSYLEQFFTDLTSEVRLILGGRSESICFVDTRSIEAADQWEQRLAEALRTSSLCVAICSQSYLNSGYCGKEYQVFLDRLNAWRSHNPGQGLRVIFPVLWVPPPSGQLPVAIKSFQMTDDEFPPLYLTEGLRYLMKLNKYKDDYERFISRLARKLVNALNETSLQDLQTLPPLAEVSNAFRSPTSLPMRSEPTDTTMVDFVFVVAPRGELRGLRTHLDAYHDESGWFWRPYYPEFDSTVGLLAQETVSKLRLRYRELEMNQSLVDRLRDLEHARDIVIFVTDAWTVRLNRYASAMRKYDEETLVNCAVIVPWNDSDAETKAHQEVLNQALQMAFPRKFLLRPPGHHWDSVRCEKDLREKFEKALSEVRMNILRVADVQRKVRSDELANEAREQGLSLNVAPNVTGPIGGSS